ncbi:DUF2971 domain-containing protein [Liberiplasma polymorphum]|uniref:DUF2971 domain-containing protein n=1 Tax=Liberiplasma polymorphum TaxID=3374570 RepID=UPI0037720504
MFSDNHLFKYNSLSSYDKENLKNKKLFLRTATKFNDVFDSTPYYSDEIFLKMLRDHINENGIVVPNYINFNRLTYQEKLKVFKSYFRHNFDSTLKDAGLISCFSKASDSNIMWVRYAKEYEGAVFVYDKTDLKNAAINHLLKLSKENLFHNVPDQILRRAVTLEDVSYSEYRPDITKELENTYEDFSKNKEVFMSNDDFDRITNKMFFFKTYEWEYEKEVRLLIHNFLNGKAYPYNDQGKTLLIDIKPVAVILGFKVPRSAAKYIIEVCLNEGISLYGSGPHFLDKKCKINVEILKKEYIEEMLK